MKSIINVIKDIEQYDDDFEQIIAEYITNGIIYSDADNLVLAKYNAATHHLFIYYCCGDIKKLLTKIDFKVTTISFYRRNKFKQYSYEQFYNKALNRV